MTLLIVFCAKYLVYIVALGAVAALLVSPHRQKLALIAVVALPLGYALARIAGMLYSHPQPFATGGFEPLVPHVVDNAFPSDHTLFAGVFASVAWLTERRVGVALWVLALAVGVGRVVAGLHAPLDIGASVLLALVAIAAASMLVSYFFQHQR